MYVKGLAQFLPNGQHALMLAFVTCCLLWVWVLTHMLLNHPRVGALYYFIKKLFRGDMLTKLVHGFLNQITMKVRASVIADKVCDYQLFILKQPWKDKSRIWVRRNWTLYDKLLWFWKIFFFFNCGKMKFSILAMVKCTV